MVGTVEEVGFRSTRIRAADTSIFQIPNSRLSELVINNSGLRLFRRYNTQLGLRYDTPPELIEAFVKGVRGIIKAHPDTKSDSFNVEFTGFGDSALLIMMNMYLKNSMAINKLIGWANFLSVSLTSSLFLMYLLRILFKNKNASCFAIINTTKANTINSKREKYCQISKENIFLCPAPGILF